MTTCRLQGSLEDKAVQKATLTRGTQGVQEMEPMKTKYNQDEPDDRLGEIVSSGLQN